MQKKIFSIENTFISNKYQRIKKIRPLYQDSKYLLYNFKIAMGIICGRKVERKVDKFHVQKFIYFHNENQPVRGFLKNYFCNGDKDFNPSYIFTL